MPRYKVLKKGYFNDMRFDPDGKRSVLVTDKPLRPCPSWLKVIKSETVAEKKKRESREQKELDASKEQLKKDREEALSMSFPESVVETL